MDESRIIVDGGNSLEEENSSVGVVSRVANDIPTDVKPVNVITEIAAAAAAVPVETEVKEHRKHKRHTHKHRHRHRDKDVAPHVNIEAIRSEMTGTIDLLTQKNKNLSNRLHHVTLAYQEMQLAISERVDSEWRLKYEKERRRNQRLEHSYAECKKELGEKKNMLQANVCVPKGKEKKGLIGTDGTLEILPDPSKSVLLFSNHITTSERCQRQNPILLATTEASFRNHIKQITSEKYQLEQQLHSFVARYENLSTQYSILGERFKAVNSELDHVKAIIRSSKIDPVKFKRPVVVVERPVLRTCNLYAVSPTHYTETTHGSLPLKSLPPLEHMNVDLEEHKSHKIGSSTNKTASIVKKNRMDHNTGGNDKTNEDELENSDDKKDDISVGGRDSNSKEESAKGIEEENSVDSFLETKEENSDDKKDDINVGGRDSNSKEESAKGIEEENSVDSFLETKDNDVHYSSHAKEENSDDKKDDINVGGRDSNSKEESAKGIEEENSVDSFLETKDDDVHYSSHAKEEDISDAPPEIVDKNLNCVSTEIALVSLLNEECFDDEGVVEKEVEEKS